MSRDANRWMFPLPAKPNFERQKKLAKQLVRAVWAGDTDAVARFDALHPSPPTQQKATLSDTQLVIARGYGLASWPGLKRKIQSLTQSPLEQWITAVKAGDVLRVKKLFEKHAELATHVNDTCFAFDSTALFAAKPNWALVDLLIEHGADVNQKTAWEPGGFGLAENEREDVAVLLFERGVVEDIWVAVNLNHVEKVQQLLDDDPTLIHARGGDGMQPLHHANTVAMVDLLIDRGADVHAKDIDHTSTPAQYQVGNAPVVRRLLAHDALPDIFIAASLGDLDLLAQCIADDPRCVSHRLGIAPWIKEAGGMIYNCKLGHGLTPMDVAIKFGHPQAHALLMQCSPAQVQLLDAAWRGDVSRGEAVLGAHPDLLSQMSEDDHAALNRACWWYRPKAVKAMLALGFNRHVQDNEQMTPLDRAAFHGHADCLAWLLNGDPDPPLEWIHQYDGTPLQTCIHGSINGWSTDFEQDHALCAKLLLDAGAKYELGWLPTGSDEIDQVLRQVQFKRQANDND